MPQTMTATRPCVPRERRPAECDELFLAALLGDAAVRRGIDDELDRRASRRIVAAMMREAPEPCAT